MARRPQNPDAAPDWRLEPHVCRSCFSRILSRPGEDGRVYLCSNCGATAAGHAPSVLCSCGMKLRGGKDMGVRCVPNEAPSPEAPYLIVARQV